jgi:hypothetical protein
LTKDASRPGDAGQWTHERLASWKRLSQNRGADCEQNLCAGVKKEANFQNDTDKGYANYD